MKPGVNVHAATTLPNREKPITETFPESPPTHEIAIGPVETPRGASKIKPYKTRHQNLSKFPPTHEITVKPVEAPRGELSAESIDNRFCDEVVQHSACARQGTKAKQKALSAKVGSK